MSDIEKLHSDFFNARRALRDFCDVNESIENTRKTLETLEKISERARVLGQTTLTAPEGYFLEVTAIPSMVNPKREQGIYSDGKNNCWGDTWPGVVNPEKIDIIEPSIFHASALQVSWRHIIAIGIYKIVNEKRALDEYPCRTVDEFDAVRLVPLDERQTI